MQDKELGNIIKIIKVINLYLFKDQISNDILINFFYLKKMLMF